MSGKYKSTVTNADEEMHISTEKEIRILALLIHQGCATSNWSFVMGFLTSSWKQHISKGFAAKNQKIASPFAILVRY